MHDMKITAFGRHAVRALLAAATAAAAITASAQTKEVEVGLIAPMSGPYARQGQVMKMAADMAIETINQQGGIKSMGGAKLKLSVFDAGDSVERAKNAAQRMVANSPDLVVATGAYLSSFTLAVTEVTERAELPVVTFSYSDLITSRGFKYVFQTSATGVQQAEGSLPALMEMAEKASGKRPQTIGIVMDNTAASVSFVKPMRDHQFAKLGLKLVVDETFTPPLANATPLIQKVRSARPDILLLLPTVISDAKLLLEKMNEFGLGRGRLPTIANGAAILDPDLRNNMNIEQLEGVMAVVANWTTNAQKDFVAEVKAKTNEPWPTQHFVTTYGDILIFKAALEAAGKADRQAVAQALRAMNLSGGAANFFPGNGKLRFEESGRRADASLLIVQWQKGVPITVYPPKDALASPLWPKQ
ncbi:MAG TPA: ABC transporter substrate-binding protein [Burkholderiales bacterium]|jgi:branched-chain amino acid transport system substrate-binding protein|nr:ABC transporter substrate-binding protein [Burkholderiales bacterium]